MLILFFLMFYLLWSLKNREGRRGRQEEKDKGKEGEEKKKRKENQRYQGNIHAKMGSIKDRNGMDLQKQKILGRGGKNTQKNCTKKIFMTQIITMV